MALKFGLLNLKLRKVARRNLQALISLLLFPLSKVTVANRANYFKKIFTVIFSFENLIAQLSDMKQAGVK